MKKFYKFEFGRDTDTVLPNFRKAAEFIPKQVYEFSRTPSQHNLTMVEIEDSSDGQNNSSFLVSNRNSGTRRSMPSAIDVGETDESKLRMEPHHRAFSYDLKST